MGLLVKGGHGDYKNLCVDEDGYVQESGSSIEETGDGQDSGGEKIEGAETADC